MTREEKTKAEWEKILSEIKALNFDGKKYNDLAKKKGDSVASTIHSKKIDKLIKKIEKRVSGGEKCPLELNNDLMQTICMDLGSRNREKNIKILEALSKGGMKFEYVSGEEVLFDPIGSIIGMPFTEKVPVDIVEWILANDKNGTYKNGNIDKCDYRGAIYIAVARQDMKLLDLLIKYGADVNYCTNDSETVVTTANGTHYLTCSPLDLCFIRQAQSPNDQKKIWDEMALKLADNGATYLYERTGEFVDVLRQIDEINKQRQGIVNISNVTLERTEYGEKILTNHYVERLNNNAKFAKKHNDMEELAKIEAELKRLDVKEKKDQEIGK